MAITKKTTAKKETTAEAMPEATIKVTGARWVNDSISFSVNINGVVINGCWYINGIKDGKDYEFLSLPQYKATNGKYYNYAYFPLNSEPYKSDIIEQLNDIVNEE